MEGTHMPLRNDKILGYSGFTILSRTLLSFKVFQSRTLTN